MRSIKTSQWLAMWLFPALQISTFVIFCYTIEKSYWAISMVLLSAFFLNFSLHITYHYTVHFPFKSQKMQQLGGFLKTVLMGQPFHYYVMSHWNHHKHNNGIEDFTTTWKSNKNQMVSKNVFFYIFFWPFSSSKSLPLQIQQGRKEGYCTPTVFKRMLIELGVLVVWFAILAWCSSIWFLGYLMMVYFGWLLIALQNYGQHLPNHYGTNKANSYLSDWYNRLFLNNGLHEEHHEEPSKLYWELTPRSQAFQSVISKPHLIAPFFLRNNKQV